MDRIQQLDDDIKTIKQDIIKQMECKVSELKAFLIEMIEKSSSQKTYADAIGSPKPVSGTENQSTENSKNIEDSGFIDEGYGDQSGIGAKRSSPETRLKTVYVADDRGNTQQQTHILTPIAHQQQLDNVIKRWRFNTTGQQRILNAMGQRIELNTMDQRPDLNTMDQRPERNTMD